jgi:anti-anti-sigma factor
VPFDPVLAHDGAVMVGHHADDEYTIDREQAGCRATAGDKWLLSDLLDIAVSTPSPGVTLLSVHGEIDMASVAQLEEHLRLYAPAPDTRCLVDLSSVTVCSSVAVRALLDAWEQAKAVRARLLLVIPSRSPVHRVFKILGLLNLDGLPVLPELELALALP